MSVFFAGLCGALAVDYGGKAVNRVGFAVETEIKSPERELRKEVFTS
jgi:hypothetical protein